MGKIRDKTLGRPPMASLQQTAGHTIILIDDLPSYRRVALLRDGALDQFWIDDAADLLPQPGVVFAARVAQIFADHDRATFELPGHSTPHGTRPQSHMASARITADQAKSLKSGQIIPVVVSALPREGKPLQVKIKGDISPKDLPPQPQLIHPAPDALTLAKATAPDAEVISDDTGERWAQYGCDEALEQACKAIMTMPNGAVLHINTPPGAAVIDLDSAGSTLTPFDLSCQMLPVVMRQIRLRRIAGPIVIDFPRLTAEQQRKLHDMIKSEAKYDPEKPSLHGFTRGGLYTMARPWRRQILSQELSMDAAASGRAALRLIRRHSHLNIQGGITISIHEKGLDWLQGDGADALKALTADLAFSPQFRSDNMIKTAMLEENA